MKNLNEQNDFVDYLNDTKGGDWYYNPKTQSYHDTLTDRVIPQEAISVTIK